MLNIKRIDHITNVEIYKRTNQLPLSDKTWVGHILRRHIEEPVRKYALYQPSEQLGSSKRRRKATYFTTYIAGIINIRTHLAAQEIERADHQRRRETKLEFILYRIIFLNCTIGRL